MEFMETLTIEGTPKTPAIHCDSNTGSISIAGNCVPEDAAAFFMPLLNWIELYKNSATKDTTCTVDLHYFNTSTSRIILTVFRQMATINNVKIVWVYEEDDEDIKEAGEDYQQILDVELELRSKPSLD